MAVNFKNLNELTFGQYFKSEADAECFVLDNKLLNLVPPPCPECGAEMRIEKIRGKPRFRCRKTKCRKVCSPLTGTWFEKCHLGKFQILKLVFLFCLHRPVTEAMATAGVASEAAVKWYNLCREVCKIVIQNEPFVPIGGPGLTIEVDETAIWKRKYYRGRVLRKQTQWIFTGVCRETKRTFVIPVYTRGVRTLVPLIKRFVGPPVTSSGQPQTIYSDGWKSYSGLKSLGYNHGIVVHKRNFLNPQNKIIHTQTVERLNLSLKEILPAKSNTAFLESHIHQFLYLRRFKDLPIGEVFRRFISDINKVYPGPGKTGLEPFKSFYITENLHEGYIC